MLRMKKHRVLISACLLGQQVRYDGNHRAQHWILERLAALVELVVLCPEVGAGLGVPRPPMQLVASKNYARWGRFSLSTIQVRQAASPDASIRLRLVDDPDQDRTQVMQKWIKGTVPTLGDLDAAILKARSPSCGRQVSVFDTQGRLVSETGQGLFAQAILASNPGLLVVDEEQLLDEAGQKNFLHYLGLTANTARK
jgi:uncharacterized protein YbbK (DUF523 family)